jgi:hypothetical protein
MSSKSFLKKTFKKNIKKSSKKNISKIKQSLGCN